MRVQNIVQNPCPICGKETTLAVIEPHPTHSGNGTPYISMCGLRAGQNDVRSTAFGWIDESGIASNSAEGGEPAHAAFTGLHGRLHASPMTRPLADSRKTD